MALLSGTSGAAPSSLPAVEGKAAPDESAIRAIEKPDPALWRYYLLVSLPSLLLPPLFLVVTFLAWVRYSTLRYTFTAEGVSMRWGRLFRREILIQYGRIQDIHLRSNVVERWLGLSRILVQTASGSSGAEMTIEGLKEYEAVRDFLYARMRGVSEPSAYAGEHSGAAGGGADALTASLREAVTELRAAREALQALQIEPRLWADPVERAKASTEEGPRDV